MKEIRMKSKSERPKEDAEKTKKAMKLVNQSSFKSFDELTRLENIKKEQIRAKIGNFPLSTSVSVYLPMFGRNLTEC